MSSKLGRYKNKPNKQEKFSNKNKNDSKKELSEEIGKDEIPGWVKGTGKYTEEDNPDRLAAETSFVILFPEYREPYLQQIWPLVQATLSAKPYLLNATLDLKAGKMFIATTEHTFDPFIIVKGRDMLNLMARGVSLQQARRVLEDDVFSDVVKIGNLARNHATFVRRRQRLLGPDGATLKALELLTDTYIFIQGKTVSVIGGVKSLKVVRRIIEDCMFNIHPIYHVKELMIKRELSKRPELVSENWNKYIPQFKKSVQPNSKVKKTKKPTEPKKEYTPFPNPPEESKIDKEIASGEYFLPEDKKKKRKDAKLKKQQEEKSQERRVEKSKTLIPVQEKQKPQEQGSGKSLVDRIKNNTDNRKRKLDHRSMSANDFVERVPKKNKH